MEKLTEKEIENLRVCGEILNNALKSAILAIKPGIPACAIDRLVEQTLRKNGATPSFLNYKSGHKAPFPSSICLSVNDEVVHGVPSEDKIIAEGDIVGLDMGAEYKGVYTDMAETIIVGKAKNREDIKLLSVTREALRIGISEAISGNTTGDIGFAIQKFVEKRGFAVVRALVGHGIGKKPHQDPQVPNYGERGKGPKLINGMAIAIEPMVTAGDYQVVGMKDGWTIKTRDGRNSAHFEHTILICDNKPEIITK